MLTDSIRCVSMTELHTSQEKCKENGRSENEHTRQALASENGTIKKKWRLYNRKVDGSQHAAQYK